MQDLIKQKFQGYPDHVRSKMNRLRQIILEVAAETDGVGVIEESLKWGEPAYLTTASKSGSTIRIDWKPKYPDQYAMYFNCNTTLVETFKTLFPDEFEYQGNRAIVFSLEHAIAEDELRFCVSMALRYHVDK